MKKSKIYKSINTNISPSFEGFDNRFCMLDDIFCCNISTNPLQTPM